MYIHVRMHITRQGSYRILSWGGGGGGGGGDQDGSSMIVICEMHACLLGGSWGMPPRKVLNLYIYLSELLLMQSGMKFLNI